MYILVSSASSFVRCKSECCDTNQIVIDVLSLNYVHIMILIVCSCSESAPCLQMHISISNITYGKMCTRYSSMSIAALGLAYICSARWRTLHVESQTNFIQIEWLYLFIRLIMDEQPGLRLIQQSHTVRTSYAWISLPLNQRRLNFLECFQTPYMEIELIRSNRFDLAPVDRGEVLQDCNWERSSIHHSHTSTIRTVALVSNALQM